MNHARDATTASTTRVGQSPHALGIADARVLVVLRREADDLAALSLRNLPNVQLIEVGELNAYDVLVNDVVVFTADTLPGAPAKDGEA